MNKCISFTIQSVENGGNRSLFLIQWSLAQPENYSQQTLQIVVKAQNCQNLLSQLSSSKSYQGYQCIYDSSQNFNVSQISRVYITLQDFNTFQDIQLTKGDCNQNQLVNPVSINNLNDVFIDFQGNNGQNLAQIQISYDQYFYLQNGNFPTNSAFLSYQKNGNSYVNNNNIVINSTNSQLQCKTNYYKISYYNLYDITPQSSYMTFQTYVHPPTFPNQMANIQIIAYYQCPIGCSQCNSSGVCSACISNYNFNSNYCYLICNSNQFVYFVDTKSSQQACKQCDSSCLSCFGGAKQCTSCNNGYYPLITTQSQTIFSCVQTCPSNYYLVNQQCQICDLSCSNCVTISNNCTSCSASYYPLYTSQQPTNNFQCSQNCPNNYYFVNNQCFICDQSCQSCSGNSNSCTTCTNGYYPLYTSQQPTNNFQCSQNCPNNYYFVNNQCFICDQSCQSCSGNSNSCTACTNGYYPLKTAQPQTIFQCYQQCPDNYYLNINQCSHCDSSCSKCNVSSTSCTVCQNGYYSIYSTQNQTIFQCYSTCPDNYYFKINNCYQCDSSCSKCTGDSTSCTACTNDYYPLYTGQSTTIFKCYQTCPNNYYLNINQCSQCDSSCSSCQDLSNICTACSSGYYPLYTSQSSTTFQCYSVCPDGYFLKNNQCLKCDISCSTCIYDFNSCISCSRNYYPLSTQTQANNFQCYQQCPNGYQLKQNICQQCQNYNSQDCQSCGKTCKFCQIYQTSNCLDCYETMNLIDNNCVCNNNQDQRNIFYQCSFNNCAVIQAYFSGDSPILTLEFGSILIPVNNLQCNQIFDSTTAMLLGNDAVIMANYTIGFNSQAQILQFQGYQKPIDTFYIISVEQKLTAQPSVIVQYNKVESSCNDISFSIQSIQNDAKRQFLQFQWSLAQPQSFSPSTLQNINSIIQQANNQQSQSLIISKYVLPPDTSITIQLFYILKVYQNNTLSFTTLNKKSKQIVIQTIQNFYPPIYRYMNISVQFQFIVNICDQSGAGVSQEPLDIQITSQALPQLSQTQNGFNGDQIELDIQAYSIPQSTSLDIQVYAVLHNDNSISTTQNQVITPQLSNLFIQISGGQDRLVDYKANNTLIGLARDYEIKDSNQPQGIQLTWQCQNVGSINGDSQCYDYLNQIYTLPSDVLTLTIPSSTFNPYQCLQFILQGQKDQRTANSKVLLILSEIDIPPLYVDFNDPTQIYQVNINDNILSSLIYDSSVSTSILTYAGAVLYNNNVVGVIKFDYFKVKLRIWDYFSNIEINNPVVQIRFSVYNPERIMPSLCIINFNINIPPQECIFSVTPSNGYSLQTQFTIQFTGCKSKNNPLTYQFFYYNQINDQLQEVQIPQNILRRQIQDQSFSDQITTILPSGNCIILGQSMDSFLAVFNSTVQLNVLPYQQDEQALLNLVEQTIQSSTTLTVRKAIVNLSILAEEISKNITLYSLPSINQAKQKLIQSILSYQNQLPNTSLLSTFVNKIIAQLQSSLLVQQNQQSSNVLDQVNQILQNQQQFITSSNSKLMDNNDFILQNLVDSFKILNSTTQNIDVNSTSFSQLQTQMDISDKIGNLLNNISLPNQGQFSMQGSLISLTCEQITSKNLQNYFYDQSQAVSADSDIYNVMITNYSKNPFNQTSGFQSYLNDLQNLMPEIQASQNPVVKPLIQDIINNSTQNQNKQLQIPFPNIQQQTKQYNLTCIQQQKSSFWSSDKCILVQTISIGGYNCFCQDQKPTTIIEDVQSVLNNKNLQTAFSSQGILNITNFSNFYEYAIFWILSLVTFLQIGLCWFGKTLDRKQQNCVHKSLATVVPTTQNNLIDHLKQQQEKQKLINEPFQVSPVQILNEQDLEKQKDNQQPIIQEIRQQQDSIQENENPRNYIIQNDQEKLSNQTTVSNIHKGQNLKPQMENKIKLFSSTNRIVKILSIVNKKQSAQKLHLVQNQKSTKQSQKYGDKPCNNIEEKNINTSFDQKIMNKDLKNEENNNINQKFLQKPLFYKILVFHNFTSIFFVYSTELSRPFRFTIYYLRVIHSLSISTIFDQKYYEGQMMMISVLNAVIITINVVIIQAFYKFRKIGKVFSSILMLGLLILYYYIILAVISGQSEEYSNDRNISFLVIFGFDFLLVSTLLSLFNVFILDLNYKYASNSLIIKLFKLLQIQDTLLNILY
ncbi:hypothetical protein ABPG72_009933 [Tetrahymena utriculariae]